MGSAHTRSPHLEGSPAPSTCPSSRPVLTLLIIVLSSFSGSSGSPGPQGPPGQYASSYKQMLYLGQRRDARRKYVFKTKAIIKRASRRHRLMSTCVSPVAAVGAQRSCEICSDLAWGTQPSSSFGSRQFPSCVIPMGHSASCHLRSLRLSPPLSHRNAGQCLCQGPMRHPQAQSLVIAGQVTSTRIRSGDMGKSLQRAALDFYSRVCVCTPVCLCVHVPMCISISPKAGTFVHLHGFLCLQVPLVSKDSKGK